MDQVHCPWLSQSRLSSVGSPPQSMCPGTGGNGPLPKTPPSAEMASATSIRPSSLQSLASAQLDWPPRKMICS